MNISGLFIHRPVTTTLLMLGILIFGVMGYKSLPVSDLPTVDFPTITVNANLAGGQLIGIELDPNRIFLRAVDIDLGNAGHHRDALRQNRLGKFIDG